MTALDIDEINQVREAYALIRSDHSEYRMLLLHHSLRIKKQDEPRPVKILYFIEHSWIIQSEEDLHFTYTFAACEWPENHLSQYNHGKNRRGVVQKPLCWI